MKVLMINTVCGIKSTGRICTDIATGLENRGHEVKIAYGRQEVPEQYIKYAVRIGDDLDVVLHGVKARLFDRAGFGSERVTRRFIEWVKEYNPDVIHLHNIHGYYINIEVLFDYLRVCGKKIIWTLHDCWAFTGHTPYCDVVGCDRWISGCYNCPLRKEYPKSFFDFSYRNWKKKNELMTCIPNMTIITPSNWLAGLVRKSFLRENPVEVIHNGIDTSKFYPMESDIRKRIGVENRFMILGVATSWDEMKGYSDYLKLANMLGDDYRIVLVGLSKRQMKKLPNNIVGIEQTNDLEELVCIYSTADILANLSYCENYPTINLEARACGTLVLTYNTGGSPESAGIESIIINKGELESAFDAIIKVRSNIGEKTILNNKESFDYRYMVNEYLKIINVKH